ncbi:hypothetical protein Vafri_8749 [Volvox africanus]|nr:hypothetical protein Vafri_8749 [Volvox africanus]
MDCFYAAVHEAERPELKRLPVAVGGIGMISTANYVARKYGVRSAMPGFIAKRLCPQLVFVPLDFGRYTAAAERVRSVFRQLDPDFESGGLDEAYLDVTDYCQRVGCSGAEAAEELRRRVSGFCGGLTCSVGVAPNKMLAKICSDINKPNGQYVLPPDRAAILSFLDTLPARKIPCIGKVTEQLLRGTLGVSTCGQLLGPERGRLPLLFSESAAEFFLEAALGLAATRHAPKVDTSQEPGRKGISCERTFRNMSKPGEQEAMAKQLVESLAADMASEDLEGRNLTLKLKLSSFEVRTRAATLPRYLRTASDMLPTVLRLLRAEGPLELRLMGVRMASLRKVNSAARSPLVRLLGLRQQYQPTNTAAVAAPMTTSASAGGPTEASAAAVVVAANGSRPHPSQRQLASAPPGFGASEAAGAHLHGSRVLDAASAAASAAAAVRNTGDSSRQPIAAWVTRTTDPGVSPPRTCWTSADAGAVVNANANADADVDGGGGGGGGRVGGGGGLPVGKCTVPPFYDDEYGDFIAAASRWPPAPGGAVPRTTSSVLRVDFKDGVDEVVTPRGGGGGGCGSGDAVSDWNSVGFGDQAFPTAAAGAAPAVPTAADAASSGAGARSGRREEQHAAWLLYDVYDDHGDGVDGRSCDGTDFAEDMRHEDGAEVLGDCEPSWDCDPWAGSYQERPQQDHGTAKRRRCNSGLGPGATAVTSTAAAATSVIGSETTTKPATGDVPLSRDHGGDHTVSEPLADEAARTGDAWPQASHMQRRGRIGSVASAPPVPCSRMPASGAIAGVSSGTARNDLGRDGAGGGADGDAGGERAECRAVVRVGSSAGPGGGGGSSALWTCKVCTYARNRRQLLRCEICDCLRGSTRPPTEAAAAAALQLHQHQQRQRQKQPPAATGNGGGCKGSTLAAASADRRQPATTDPFGRKRFASGGPQSHRHSQLESQGQRHLERLWAAAATTTTAAQQQQPQPVRVPVPSPVSTTRVKSTATATAGRPAMSISGTASSARRRHAASATAAPSPPLTQPHQQPQPQPQPQPQQHQQPHQAAPSRICPQCGAAVAAGWWTEHQDWHLAVRLSREETV